MFAGGVRRTVSAQCSGRFDPKDINLSLFVLRDNGGSARVFRYLLIVHLSAFLCLFLSLSLFPSNSSAGRNNVCNGRAYWFVSGANGFPYTQTGIPNRRGTRTMPRVLIRSLYTDAAAMPRYPPSVNPFAREFPSLLEVFASARVSPTNCARDIEKCFVWKIYRKYVKLILARSPRL